MTVWNPFDPAPTHLLRLKQVMINLPSPTMAMTTTMMTTEDFPGKMSPPKLRQKLGEGLLLSKGVKNGVSLDVNPSAAQTLHLERSREYSSDLFINCGSAVLSDQGVTVEKEMQSQT